MHLKRFHILLLFLAVLVFDVCLLQHIEEKTRQMNCFSYETAQENFRNHRISEETLAAFMQASEEGMNHFAELMTMYFAEEGLETDVKLLEQDMVYAMRYHGDEFRQLSESVLAVWQDLKRFPVGRVQTGSSAAVRGAADAGGSTAYSGAANAGGTAFVTFADSWMQSRTFGGERGHEGTDIMPEMNQRGIYPVYSMTDGVVENIGWLKLGGYRIGIRSDSGAYFYYAHLAEYAKEFEIGERVTAGTHLGYMGDTGYSEVPGTTGMFDVHLHLGIYLYDGSGTEYSVNSYPMLRYLWEQESNGDTTG